MTNWTEAQKALDDISEALHAPLPVTEVKTVREALAAGEVAERRLTEARLAMVLVGPANVHEVVAEVRRILEGAP